MKGCVNLINLQATVLGSQFKSIEFSYTTDLLRQKYTFIGPS